MKKYKQLSYAAICVDGRIVAEFASDDYRKAEVSQAELLAYQHMMSYGTGAYVVRGSKMVEKNPKKRLTDSPFGVS